MPAPDKPSSPSAQDGSPEPSVAGSPPPFCSFSADELLKMGMKLGDRCDGCTNKVCFHPRSAEAKEAPAAAQAEQDRRAPKIADLQRLASSVPKWTSKSVCRTFLQRIEQVMEISDIEPKHWAKVLVLAVQDVAAAEWIKTHIVQPGLDWSAAQTVFTDHFQVSDHHEAVRLEYLACKQSKQETVQAYADRFLDLVTQLGRDPDHESVRERFLDGLIGNVRNKYEQQLVTQRLLNPDFDLLRLDRIVAVTIQLDVAQRTALSRASASSTGAGASTSGGTSHKHSESPSGSSSHRDKRHDQRAGTTVKHCRFHPGFTTHSTSECRTRGSKGNNGGNGFASQRDEKQKPSASGGAGRKQPTCYSCNKPGHISPNCPERQKGSGGAQQSAAGTDGPRRSQRLQDRQPSSSTAAPGTTVNVSSRAVLIDGQETEHQPDTPIGFLSAPSPVVRASAVDRTLPASVLAPTAGAHEVLLLYSGIPYTTLLDTGSNKSCIDAALAAELQLPIQPKPGTVQLAHAGLSVKRVGVTDPLPVTAIFLAPGMRLPAQQHEVEFEVLPLESHKYQFLLGMDLIHKLFPVAVPTAFLEPAPATAPSLAPAARRAAVLDYDESTTHLCAAAWDEIAKSDVCSIDELAGSGSVPTNEMPVRLSLGCDPELEAVYAARREQLMSDPDIVEALETNASITGFCSLPESVVHLEIDPDKKHKLYTRQYPVPHVLYPKVTEIVDRWYDTGRIVLAPPGCEYNNPLTCAPKKDDTGQLTGVRLCLDTRRLNGAIVVHDRFQLPYIRQALEQFSGSTIFGEFDLQEAYLQFPMHPDSQPYTAFTWNGKQYMFVGAPFGIATLPSHFQRTMSVAFADLPFTFPYLDNLPFGSDNWPDHRDHGLTIISRLNQMNLKIKPSSVKLGYSHIRCLGHQLSGGGISIDPDKLVQLAEWPLPRTGPELQSFLGFVTFMRQHVRQFSDLTAPLEAVKLQKQIEWTDTLRHHFELTKQALARAPVLRFPDFSRPFHIATDASNTGVGGVLFQPDEGSDEVTAHNIVAIHSKKLTPTQYRYSAYKKELLAIVQCLRQFHTFVWGRMDNVLHTDHKPLTWMLQSVDLSQALQQWLDVILDYRFEIRHRPGILNVLPDALSRMYASQYEHGVWGVPSSSQLPDAGSGAESTPAPLSTVSLRALRPAPMQSSADAVAVSGVPSGPVSAGEGAADIPADSEQDTESDADDEQARGRPHSVAVEMERRGKTCPSTDEEKRALIESAHQLGHFGRDAIWKSLYQRGYWWLHLNRDIADVLANCDSCTRYTVTKAGYNPASYITAPGPWHHIQVDTSVHLPASKDGYTALLVVIDVFTGFVVLRPVRSTSADIVARELWELFCLFGLPKIVQSDNGPEFVNDTLRALIRLVGINHRFISPYNPRADGKVERAIGSVMSVIKKELHGRDADWPLFVPFAQLAFNAKVSALTGSTPFSLMFGRSLTEPYDYTGVPSGTDPQPISLADWRKHQDKIVSVIYPAVATRILVSKKKLATTLDRHRRQLMQGALPNGAVVMLIDPTRSSKFEPKYTGPYTIVRRARNGAYVLRDATGDMLDRHVPPDQLKLVSRKPRAADVANTTYEVQSIVGHRGSPGSYEYDVKWKDHNDRTWEPASSFLDDTVIRNYWRQVAASSALAAPPAAAVIAAAPAAAPAMATAPVPVPTAPLPVPAAPPASAAARPVAAPVPHSAAAQAAVQSIDAVTAAVTAAATAASAAAGTMLSNGTRMEPARSRPGYVNLDESTTGLANPSAGRGDTGHRQ